MTGFANCMRKVHEVFFLLPLAKVQEFAMFGFKHYQREEMIVQRNWIANFVSI